MKMHLNLATRDLEASVAFYRTLLRAFGENDARDDAASDEDTCRAPAHA